MEDKTMAGRHAFEPLRAGLPIVAPVVQSFDAERVAEHGRRGRGLVAS
jgi:hypothetical protein